MDCKKTAERCLKEGNAPVNSQPVNAPVPVMDDVDPFCLPDKPVVVNIDLALEARDKISDGIINTQCKKSHFSQLTGMEIYLKCEFQQYTGSFKERGARFALMKLSDEQKKIGAVSASLGNHSQGMCYHGACLGIPITVVMPVVAPIMKVANCRRLGGNVVLQGQNMAEAKKIAMRLGKEKGLVFINGYDHPHIIAGQGTCGLEILDQVPNVDAILIPVGGGGLLAGVALAVKHLKPEVKIYGIETDRCASFGNSMKEGKPTLTEIGPTLADGLAVPLIGFNSFATAKPLVDKMVAVTEESLSLAILRLIEMEKFVVEGAGATGLAAVLSGLVPELKGKTLVLILSGGNIDTTMLGRCVDRGLATDGRLLRVVVTLSDRPGGLEEFCHIAASLGVSIKHILQQRAWIKADVYTVEVTAVIETQDKEHAKELKKALQQRYSDVNFVDLVE